MKVYLITGASSDIGQEYIRTLDERKEECTVLGQYYQNGAGIKELADSLIYVKLIPYQCDLSDAQAVEGWLAQMDEAGHVPSYILHLAASRFDYMRFSEYDRDRTTRELNIQVHAIATILKRFLPDMVNRRYGKIVFMLTAYTIGVPPKFMSDYIITKYALLGLMKSVASEYAGKGININGISPNMMETKFLSGIDKRTIEMNARNSAMSRNVWIEETVAGIEYLFSDAAAYLQGVNLNMSGGDRME